MAEVEDILRDLKIETEMLRDIKDVGRDIMITCPFHKGGRESKPSFGVSKYEIFKNSTTYEAGLCHCYTCGWKGGLPKLVGSLLDKTEYEGFRWLVNKYTYGAGKDRAELNLFVDRGIAKEVRDYENHKLDADGKQYLNNRGLSDSVLELFKIGQVGNYIVFPIFDRKGIFKFNKRRNFKTKDKSRRFLNDEEVDKSSILYGLDIAIAQYKKDDVLYVTEGEIDTLTLWTWGKKSVAIMSADMSEAQIKELINSPYRTLILALDGDEAGRKGIRKIKNNLIPLGFKLYTVVFPKGKKDINELSINEFKDIKII